MTEFPDDASGRRADPTERAIDSEHTAWENQPRGGWDEFRRARDLLLLGLAIDSALHSSREEGSNG